MTKPLASLCWLLLAACGTDAVAPEPEPEPQPLAPTYWQHVEPIFYTNCVTCHTEGGIGPFAIDDPDTAIAFAAAIAEQTASREMPPWPPGGDTPALRHVRSLTQAQIDTIAAWAAAGAPLGDPSAPQPRVEPEVIDLGPTELGFDIGVDYVADPLLTDDYRCFLAPIDTDVVRAATGFVVTPGNRATVHHVIVTLFAGTDRAALEALDAESPERAGWPCVGGAVPEGSGLRAVGGLGSWVPGVSAVKNPEGTAQLIPAGAVAVIQMHYNTLGGSDPDRTRIDVALAPTAETGSLVPLRGLGLIKRNLTIAADDPASVHTASATVQQWLALRGQQLPPSGKGYLVGAGGHMHLIGKSLRITRRGAAGTTVLLDIPRWDFHWQGQYLYVEPIEVAATDTLELRCEYDNSNTNRLAHGLQPNVEVTWGEGTQDEMCLASLQVVERLP